MGTTAATEGERRLQRLFVGGAWTDAGDRDRHPVVSPATEEIVGEQPLATMADAEAAVASAHRAFADGVWHEQAPSHRSATLERVAELLERRADELVELIGAELGQRPSVARLRVSSAVDVWRRAAADVAEATRAIATATSDGRTAEIRRVPIGVALAVTPWNSPLLLASMKASSALAAGCSVVLKPAQEAPLTLHVLADVLADAEIPPGVVSVLPAGVEVTRRLVADERIGIVSFTGSTMVGSTIAASCAERIARVVLELGGKSPAIVLPGADPARIVPALIDAAGLATAGQVCTARTRVLVPRSELPKWEAHLGAAMGALVVGPPDDPATDVGPLATARQLASVLGYIEAGLAEGARLVCGGRRPPSLDRGYFVEPTLFADVDNTMRIAQEEIFGPVVCLIGYDDPDHAVELANDSPYGLAASVFGPDELVAHAVAAKVRAGTVHVNTGGAAYNLPFGGFRRSGVGRECGVDGIRAYLETIQVVG